MGHERTWRPALSMKTIYVVTEGYSEVEFVKKVLADYFSYKDIILIPCNVVTSKDRRNGRVYKGGMTSYAKAENTIKKCLLDAQRQPNSFVTTMFDFYKLPDDSPGLQESLTKDDHYEKVQLIEQRMLTKEKLTKTVFIPYIQLHEFETLLFTDIKVLGNKYFENDITELQEATKNEPNPELINNGEETSPSKRIIKCMPDYDKPTMGVTILQEIGLEKLRKSCRHFNEWICKMEGC